MTNPQEFHIEKPKGKNVSKTDRRSIMKNLRGASHGYIFSKTESATEGERDSRHHRVMDKLRNKKALLDAQRDSLRRSLRSIVDETSTSVKKANSDTTRDTSEALSSNSLDMELENERLKRRVKELEARVVRREAEIKMLRRKTTELATQLGSRQAEVESYQSLTPSSMHSRTSSKRIPRKRWELDPLDAMNASAKANGDKEADNDDEEEEEKLPLPSYLTISPQSDTTEISTDDDDDDDDDDDSDLSESDDEESSIENSDEEADGDRELKIDISQHSRARDRRLDVSIHSKAREKRLDASQHSRVQI